jgi:23S rRNA-/tRNA-specific pseudouridylate synthase
LESCLRLQLGGQRNANEPPYIALPHRLDRAVSGVILVALSKRAAGLLGQQFETRKVAKTYLAWVQGQFPSEQDRWVDQLRKVADQSRAEVVPLADGADTVSGSPGGEGGAGAKGQQAITAVRCIQRQPWGSLLELSPLTGRMHQLRVQCAQRGHPILGDRLYGSSQSWLGDPAAAAGAAIALHAWKICFRDPRNGKAVTVAALPPWPDQLLP